MEKSDTLYYIGYGLVFAVAGIFLFMWASNILPLGGAFAFWLLSIGIIVICLGFVKTQEAPKGSKMLLGSGTAIVVIAAVMMVIGLNIMSLAGGIAIIVACIGLGIIGMGLFRRRG